MSNKKAATNSLLIVIAIIGCIVASVLIFEHFKPGADIGCAAVGGNCAAAQNSDFGHIGPIPVSFIGLAMYLTVLGLAVKRYKVVPTGKPDARYTFQPSSAVLTDTLSGSADTDDTVDPDPPISPETVEINPSIKTSRYRTLSYILWGITAFACGISIWLQYVSLFQLTSFCPWCMTSAILCTVMFVTLTLEQLYLVIKISGEQKLLVGTVTLIIAMGAFMVFPDVMHRIEVAAIEVKAAKNGPVVLVEGQPPIITKDMETTGNPNAPFTLVEFADYQCPHCARTSLMLKEEMKKHPDNYRLAFRNYPLPIHHWANQAAQAAEAAGEQGKFWEMHDYIFAHQKDMEKTTFNQDEFVKYATVLGLDPHKFEEDMASDKILGRVSNDAVTAPRLDIKMTPSFFILHGPDTKHAYQLTGLEPTRAALENPKDKAWQ